MQSLISSRVTPWVLALLLAVASAACTTDKIKAPALAGPSEFGLSIDMSATPDILKRDGSSQAILHIVARDPSGKGIPGQRFRLSMNPANGGTLTEEELVTGADGRGTVGYTAAAADLPIQRVVIGASPIGGNFDNSRTQTVTISLRGAPAPVPAFTFSPTSPKQFDLVTFDATGTTLDGRECKSQCAFSWTFGTEGTATGDVVAHRFEKEGIHTVTLTVVGPDGVTTSLRRVVTVSAAPLPEAKFSVSPTDAAPGEDVFFNASASVAKGGASIVEYTWDFGNGSTGSGVSAKSSYGSARSYTVTLTVKDSNGLTATASATVAVKEPE